MPTIVQVPIDQFSHTPSGGSPVPYPNYHLRGRGMDCSVTNITVTHSTSNSGTYSEGLSSHEVSIQITSPDYENLWNASVSNNDKQEYNYLKPDGSPPPPYAITAYKYKNKTCTITFPTPALANVRVIHEEVQELQVGS